MARTTLRLFLGVDITRILVLVCFVSTLIALPASAHGPVHVKPGQSIQAAIDAAKPGDKIIVEAGTYAEQLSIQKDGIALVGKGAVLVPPATLQQNECSGLAGPDTDAGICVSGSGIVLAPFKQEHRKVLSVAQPVKHVSISGFQVRGFSGENIALVGAADSQITGNWLYDGVQYGALTAGCTNAIVSNNAVISTTEILAIGICTDNFAGSQVLNNHVSGYFVGLCIQTSGSDIRNNDVSDCCVDAFIDPGVKGATVQQNRFSAFSPKCNATLGGGGIIIDGAIDSDVRYNLIEGQLAGGNAAGVLVLDDFTTDPVSIAQGNVVDYNTLTDNDFDIFDNSTGAGNVFVDNSCSTPKELCS